MNTRLFFLLFLLISSFSFANSKQEIDHLLEFVEKTDCLYQRNGTDHNGTEARKHIQKKYDYYRDDIKTAEDFIEYSAAQSMMSGKKYTISCKGEEVLFSGDWLNNELKTYRSQSLEK